MVLEINDLSQSFYLINLTQMFLEPNLSTDYNAINLSYQYQKTTTFLLIKKQISTADKLLSIYVYLQSTNNNKNHTQKYISVDNNRISNLNMNFVPLCNL